VHALLELAWNDDPLTTLKLILNMTKLLRERSYFPLVWLYHNHPRTIAFNVRSFADCGYLKDFSPLLLKLLGYNDYSQEEYEYKKFTGLYVRTMRMRNIISCTIGYQMSSVTFSSPILTY
jgi:hypothetical protein